MTHSRFETKVRIIRRRQGWRQQDVAARAGLSREAVSRIERGKLDGVTVGTVERLAHALDARLRMDLDWRGAELDRLIDAGHASLADRVAGMLAGWGWQVLPEVSFNIYGDRGRYDLLAFHAPARILLVVEIKTAIGDLQETLGRVDVKVRVASRVARQRGWIPTAVVPVIVLAESMTARRHVARHPSLFANFPVRGRAALAWLRSPGGVPTGLLLLLSSSDSRHVTTNSRLRARKVNGGHAA